MLLSMIPRLSLKESMKKNLIRGEALGLRALLHLIY